MSNFDHFACAVDGLTPNFKHFTFAVFGRRVTITVTPVPPVSSGGGYYDNGRIPDTNRYVVTVKIEYKGKTWTEEKEIGAFGLLSLEKVIAAFKYVTSIRNPITLSASFVKKHINRIIINISKR